MSRLWALSLAMSLLLPTGAQAAPVCKGADGYADVFNGRRTFLWRPDWLVADLGRCVDIDLWRQAPAGRGLKVAVDFIAPYVSREKEFPYPDLKPGPSENSSEVFSRVAWAYDDLEYRRAAAALANYNLASEVNLTIARQ